MKSKGKAAWRWLALAMLATALMVLMACPALAADSRVTVTPGSTELTPGDGVVLMISAPGAQALRLYQEVDGVTLEEYSEFDGEKAMWRDHQDDSRTYYATACFDGVWSEPSEKVLVSVAYEGVLTAPVVTVPKNAQAGETLTFTWSSVENAEEYDVEIVRDDGEWICYRYTEGGTLLSLPFQWQAGNYTIHVTPWRENWDDTKATGSADFTVTGAIEAAPQITFDAPEVYLDDPISCTVTKPGATKFQIEYENAGWTDELVAVNGTATGEYGAWDYGEARFRATAYVDGAWTAWSDWAVVDVVPLGTIADPAPTAVISEDGQVTIEWPMVEHSISCDIDVFDSTHFIGVWRGNKYFDETTGDTASVTLDCPLPAGEYMAIVHLYAFSDDYKCESDGACLFTMTRELAPAPEVTVEEDRVPFASSAHITVAAEGMEKVMIRTNRGSWWVSNVSESPWTFDAYSYGNGSCKNTYEFSAYVNGAWTEWSKPVTITFYSNGTIGTPVITVPETIEAGNDLTVSWTPVENVYHYSIWIYNDEYGSPAWTCEADQTSFVIPQTLEPGTYTVSVQGVPASSWEWGDAASTTVTVTGDMAAGPLVTVASDHVAKNNNAYFTIIAPGATKLRCRMQYPASEFWSDWVDFDPNPNGEATIFEWAFLNEEKVEVSFSACVNGLWTAMSEPVTISVARDGIVQTPVMIMDDSMVAGGQVTLGNKWVPNSDWPYFELYRNGRKVEDIAIFYPQDGLSAEIWGPVAAGIYEVRCVIPPANEGWYGSAASKLLTVTGELAQGPELLVSQSVGTPDTSFVFSVNAPGAEGFCIYTEKYDLDGNCYDKSIEYEYAIDEWSWTENYDYGRSVFRISAKIDGLWTAYSEPVTVIVEDLEPPTVTILGEPKAGEPFDITWTPVKYALAYGAWIVDDAGNMLSPDQTILDADVTGCTIDPYDICAGTYNLALYARVDQMLIGGTTPLVLGEPDPDKAFGYYCEEGDDGIWISAYLGSAPTELVIPETIDGQTVAFINGFGMTDLSQLKRLTIPASVTYIHPQVAAELKNCTDLTIAGYSGSAAEAFAQSNGYTFEELEDVEEGVAASWDAENVLVNQETVFTITAPGASEIQARVNDVIQFGNSNVTLTETGALCGITFTQTGSQNVQFIVSFPDSDWIASEIYTVEVKSIGKMDAPANIAPVGDAFYTGDAITFTWDTVEGAAGYNAGFAVQGCDTGDMNIWFAKDPTWTLGEMDLPYGPGAYELVVQTVGSAGYVNSDFVRYPVTVAAHGVFDYVAVEQAVVGYYGDETDIVIPSVIDGLEMKMIFHGAFTEKDITSVVISEGFETIGYSTFENCPQLKTVVLPSTLTAIRPWAFCACDALESLVIPASVTEMGENALPESGITIYGYTGTAAEAYATANSLTFIALDGETAADAAFTLAQQTVYLDASVTLNVTAPDAQKLRVYVDGVVLADEFAVTDGAAEINVPMQALGEHTVTVAQYALGAWQEPCAAQTVTVVEGSSVTLTPESQFMIPGERRMIRAICTSLEMPVHYTWSSSDDAVATVASDVVTAVGVGTATITVTVQLSDGAVLEGTCEVEVRELSMLDLPDELTAIEAEAFLASPAQCVVLESAVETVGESAFANSAALQLVIVKGVNTTFADDAFSGCGNVTFACVENSAAHTFAQSNGIPCFFIAQ